MNVNHIRHYAIRFVKPITSAAWFELAESMEKDMRSKGFDIYEFHLASERDRSWMQSLGTVEYLEGHVGLPKSGRINPDELALAMIDFLARYGIEVKSMVLE